MGTVCCRCRRSLIAREAEGGLAHTTRPWLSLIVIPQGHLIDHDAGDKLSIDPVIQFVDMWSRCRGGQGFLGCCFDYYRFRKPLEPLQ